MSQGNRVRRVEQLVRRIVSEKLIKDIGVYKVERVTVTDVEMSPDLRHAKIFFSILADDEEEKQEIFLALKKTKSEVRYILGQEIDLRFVPELQFELDETAEKAARIEELINQIREQR